MDRISNAPMFNAASPRLCTRIIPRLFRPYSSSSYTARSWLISHGVFEHLLTTPYSIPWKRPDTLGPYRTIINWASSTMSSQKHTLADGRVVSYQFSRVPSGPVVLLSNSLAAPFRSWDKVASVLENKGYSVLRYDQPGHGETSAPSDVDTTTFESMADDVLALVQSLKIDEIHAWIGVSMGAAKGVVFAAKNPGLVGKLVVCDTISSSPVVAGTTDVFEPRIQKARSDGSMDAMVEATLARWFSEDWRNKNPSEVRRMREIMMTTQVDGFVTCCRALQSDTFDLSKSAPKVGTSVNSALLVVGELDANLPEDMKTLQKQTQKGFDDDSASSGKGKSAAVNVELKVIKDAGHVSYVDGFDQFCDIVTKYLAS